MSCSDCEAADALVFETTTNGDEGAYYVRVDDGNVRLVGCVAHVGQAVEQMRAGRLIGPGDLGVVLRGVILDARMAAGTNTGDARYWALMHAAAAADNLLRAVEHVDEGPYALEKARTVLDAALPLFVHLAAKRHAGVWGEPIDLPTSQTWAAALTAVRAALDDIVRDANP